MGLAEQVEGLIAFFDTYRAGERRLDRRTAPHLITLGNAFESVHKPCNLQDLQREAGVRSRNFAYEQLGRVANWPRQARHALRQHAAYRALREQDGELRLSVDATPMPDDRHQILWLVTIAQDPQVIDCAVRQTADPAEDLRRLLTPLAGPTYSDVSITLVDATRVVAPDAHVARILPGDVEYVIRASGNDPAPILQNDMIRDPKPPFGWTIAAALAHWGPDRVDVRHTEMVDRVETIMALDRTRDAYLLMRARVRADPTRTYSGRERNARVGTLWEMADAVDRGTRGGDVQVVSGFRSRESSLPIENLCLLRAVLTAAGVAVER